ncbi:maleylpyruvate isomerase family mycothiol-dependent enzyme [Nocardioides sp. BYT-33-1]|uniref:maleylpyruvate isomerase family mycothiol-dependent enzyme n=1 Tax=Nocardioides sp. BYT-33-1 TaxID=3416952 RepID=UPI003F52FC2B
MTTSETTVFLQAADMFADLCRQVPDGAWTRPGLGEWDVRALAGHTLRAVTTVAAYLDQPAAETAACPSAGEYFARVRTMPGADDRAVAERGRRAGRDLGADPAAAVRAAVARTRDALAVVAGRDPIVATIAGGMRLSDYLPTRTFELLAHSLDLCAATDLVLEPPPAVVESAVVTAAAALTHVGDGVATFRHLIGRAGGAHRPLFG